MEPNVRLLRYFLAVAEAGTFTQAAEILHVSQPALSQQIKKLEGELGFALFQRGTRQVTLTARGKDLISSARRVVEAAEAYRNHARSLAGGTLELTIGYRAAHETTRAVVDAFRAERPDIAVTLRHYPMAATHAGLDVGEVELAVLRLPVDLSGLQTLTLYTEPRIVLLPSGHALACRTRIHLADLAGLPWVTTEARDPVWQAHAQPIAENWDQSNASVVVDTLDEFLEAVTAGRGVGLAPASASRLYARPGVAFIEVADAEPSVGALAWRREAPEANPTVAAFVRSARLFVHRQQRGQ
ncbi:MAG: transcriptional regulator [Actinomycetia bacterium]|nr:transcriptional regulator [Actinomycetes bacterium]